MTAPGIALKGVAKKSGENTFLVERTRIVETCRLLRDAGFEHLSLITAVDWKEHWEVIYHIVQFGRKDVVTLRVNLPYQDPEIPSVTSVWPGANWHERETYDLMGISFVGHPDLRRILLPEDFKEFPLRKEVLHGNRS